MAAKYSSQSLSPFIFSKFNRFCIVAFFGIAILAVFVDSSVGRDFPSDNNLAIRSAYLLALIYFFWSGIDSLVWIIRKPDMFLEIAKRKSRKKGGPLSQNPGKIWFYYFYAILMLFLGVVELVLIIKKMMI
jgi:hypothetical protein